MPGTHIRISEAARNLLDEARKQTGKSYIRLLDEALCTNEEGEDGGVTSSPEVKPTKSYAPLPKPAPSVIDAQILMCWEHQKDRIYRGRSKPSGVLEDISLSRKELLKAARQKMNLGYYPRKAHAPVQLNAKQRTWGEIYPEWFKNHQRSRSQFQIYFDNRLTALVKKGLLRRVEDGHYKLNALYPEYRYKNAWAVIRGITLLPPQEGLEIPHMVFSGQRDKGQL